MGGVGYINMGIKNFISESWSEKDKEKEKKEES